MEKSQAIQKSLVGVCNGSLRCFLWGLNSFFISMSLLCVPFHSPFSVPICILLYLPLGYINTSIQNVHWYAAHFNLSHFTIRKNSHCSVKLPLHFMSMETAWEWRETLTNTALLGYIIVYTCYASVNNII